MLKVSYSSWNGPRRRRDSPAIPHGQPSSGNLGQHRRRGCRRVRTLLRVFWFAIRQKQGVDSKTYFCCFGVGLPVRPINGVDRKCFSAVSLNYFCRFKSRIVVVSPLLSLFFLLFVSKEEPVVDKQTVMSRLRAPLKAVLGSLNARKNGKTGWIIVVCEKDTCP